MTATRSQTGQPDGANIAPPATPHPVWRWGRRLFRVVQWTVNIAVVAGLVLTYSPMGVYLGIPLVHDDPLVKADYIIVLGGSPERAVEAARLYQEGWAKKLVITSYEVGANEMARIAIAYGVSPEDIIRDGQATRTHDHPRTIAAAAGLDPASARVIIVTDAIHTSRARASFLHEGYKDVHMRALPWQMTGFRYPGATPHLRMVALYALAREYAGWALYTVRGWV